MGTVIWCRAFADAPLNHRVLPASTGESPAYPVTDEGPHPGFEENGDV